MQLLDTSTWHLFHYLYLSFFKKRLNLSVFYSFPKEALNSVGQYCFEYSTIHIMVLERKDINDHYLLTDINVTNIKYVMVKNHML